jgi:MFS family permease
LDELGDTVEAMQLANPRGVALATEADRRVAVLNARWYFAGLTASLLGNSAMSLVAGVWVKSLTGSSSQAGLVSACIYAGTMGAPVAGVIADRLPRKRLLLSLNLLSAATLLPLLVVSSRATLWIVFVAMAAYGIEGALVDPAEDALFAQMFSPEFRRKINGWRLSIQEIGRLVAPLLGAGLFVIVGGGAVAALDAATFVFAALVITRVAVDDHRPVHEPEPLMAALLAGAHHLLRTPTIRPIAVSAAAIMAVSGVGVAAQYSLVQGVGQHPAFLGVFTALLGAGSIIASLTAGRLIARVGERRLAVIGLLNFAAGNVLRADHWLPAALLGSLVLGFALPYVFLATLNVAQRQTPNRLQGRISAALTLALFGPQALAQAIGSALIAHSSYIAIYLGSAAASLAIAGWLARERPAATP